MPDIAMCRGGECAVREFCYRYTAESSEFHQSYFLTPPLEEDGSCGRFLHACERGFPEPNTNSRVDKAERREELRCSFCRPNRNENAKRKARGDSYKSKRRGK